MNGFGEVRLCLWVSSCGFIKISVCVMITLTAFTEVDICTPVLATANCYRQIPGFCSAEDIQTESADAREYRITLGAAAALSES